MMKFTFVLLVLMALAPLFDRYACNRLTRILLYPMTFMAALGAMLIAHRWPSLAKPGPYNPDEAQMAAQAMRFWVDWVPWRAADTTSSGPLNSYVLTLPRLFGLEINFANTRMVGLALLLIAMGCLYFTLRRFLDDCLSRILVTSVGVFFAFTLSSEFLHYSSELLPCALLAGAVLILCASPSTFTPAGVYLAGLLLGACPFAKLQAAPIALAVSLAGLVIILLYRTRGERRPYRFTMLFCLGGLTIPGIILLMTMLGDVLFDAWMSYIVRNTEAETNPRTIENVRNFFRQSLYVETFYRRAVWLAVLALLIASVSAAVGRSRAISRMIGGMSIDGLVIILYFVASLASVLFVGRFFLHYHAFLLFPTILLAGWLLHLGILGLSANRPRLAVLLIAIVATVIFFANGLSAATRYGMLERQQTAIREEQEIHAKDPLLKAILLAAQQSKDLAQQSDGTQAPQSSQDVVRMSVWGWSAEYYVQTGILPATRDVITENQWVGHPEPITRYFRDRYLSDLKAAPPEIFVDAIERFPYLDLNDLRMKRHESWPALKRFIEANYVLAASLLDGGRRADVFLLQRIARSP